MFSCLLRIKDNGKKQAQKLKFGSQFFPLFRTCPGEMVKAKMPCHVYGLISGASRWLFRVRLVFKIRGSTAGTHLMGVRGNLLGVPGDPKIGLKKIPCENRGGILAFGRTQKGQGSNPPKEGPAFKRSLVRTMMVMHPRAFRLLRVIWLSQLGRFS